MEADSISADPPPPRRRWRPDLFFAIAVFGLATAAVAYGIADAGGVLRAHTWPFAVFLLAYGLFTISMGYPHPTFGHVSFDRVGQLASILILGPVDAAWINGLASFLYPWHRLARGVPLVDVVTAAFNNAGLMALVVLSAGVMYTVLGGPVPLLALDLRTMGLLVLVLLLMQVINDLGMMLVFYFRSDDPVKVFSFFSVLVELSGGLIAVVVAVVYNRMELPVFALLLAVLSLGMLVHRQFAHIRLRLESLVDERTRELKAKSLELERQATHDKLTGLYNRRYADEFLDREIDNARRYGHELAVALADVDFFKTINDSHSHAKGDLVLTRVSAVLTERCRKTDMIARYGGEEFLLCFPETGLEQSRRLCDELRRAVQTQDWSDVGPGVKVTLSFGLSACDDQATRKTLLAAADDKLYTAKNNGRNQVAV